MSAGMFPLQSPKSKERGDRIPFVGPSKQGPIDWPLNSMSWPLLASHFPILLVGWIQEALQVKSGSHTLIFVWLGWVDSRGSASKVREPYTHVCLAWWGGFKRLYK